MKTKILFTIIFNCLYSAATIGQAIYVPKEFDHIDPKGISFKYHDQIIPYTQIGIHNIQRLFGQPIKIKKGKSPEANYAKYYYAFGHIDILNDEIDDFVISQKGIACILKTKGRYTEPIEIGTDANHLIKLFPLSWRSREPAYNIIWVPLSNSDVSLKFKVQNRKIKSMGFSIADRD